MRGARAARIALLGLIAGTAAGLAAASDIRSSFGKGRIAPAAVAAAEPPGRAPPLDGYELAAGLGLTARDDCRTLEPALRPGCLDFVARRRESAAAALDLPF